LAIGAVGLTASAGVAAWVEFLLLRRAMQKRIGPVEPVGGFELKLWAAAILAGIASVAVDRLLIRPHVKMIIAEAILASGIFGAVYFAVAFVLGVAEVRAFLSRFR